jgi:lipopolysaccharide export system protein LptC
MIGRQASETFDGAATSRWGGIASAFAERLARLPGNRHSRRVALLKLALPAIGVTLLLLVIAWPRVAPLFDRLRFPAIDLREARELRMLNPRYAGTDRNGNPFVVTAAVGRQAAERNDVMALDNPEADLKTRSGANMVLTADSGVYQTQTQFLDAFGHVKMAHENGTTIITPSARLDAVHNAAEGHERVEGHGPNGDIVAQGFHVLDKGAIVIFTGHSNLLLKGTRTQPDTVVQAGVPAPIAQAAVQLEKADLKTAAAGHAVSAKPAERAPHKAAATAPAHRKPGGKHPS